MGSRVHGIPRDAAGAVALAACGERVDVSDLDLAVLCEPETIVVLEQLCDNPVGRGTPGHEDEDGNWCESAGDEASASLRFGKLNVLCFTDEAEFDEWRRTAIRLELRGPVTREEAVEAYQAASLYAREIQKENSLSGVQSCQSTKS